MPAGARDQAVALLRVEGAPQSGLVAPDRVQRVTVAERADGASVVQQFLQFVEVAHRPAGDENVRQVPPRPDVAEVEQVVEEQSAQFPGGLVEIVQHQHQVQARIHAQDLVPQQVADGSMDRRRWPGLRRKALPVEVCRYLAQNLGFAASRQPGAVHVDEGIVVRPVLEVSRPHLRVRHDEPDDVRLAHASQASDGDAAQFVERGHDLPDFFLAVIGRETGLFVYRNHGCLLAVARGRTHYSTTFRPCGDRAGFSTALYRDC